jgi:hypothetical protein
MDAEALLAAAFGKSVSPAEAAARTAEAKLADAAASPITSMAAARRLKPKAPVPLKAVVGGRQTDALVAVASAVRLRRER